MNYQSILTLIESNPGMLLLFTVIVSIVALEAMVYIRSIRYILFGILISGLLFIALSYYFFGFSLQNLSPALYFIIGTSILLSLTFVLALFIFILLLIDLLLVLHTFFLMDLNSIYTWIVGIILAIIFYLILHYYGKKLNKLVFEIDDELKRGATKFEK
ncbi:MAG: hypothetical protein GPW16_05295 [Euryarchaeota archaeon]|nr:hypothetical protein [Euryarchaeota archaeon]